MTPSSFPSPAQLVVENITLLAGSPTAFHARYGFAITASTFEKPAHFNSAAAVLHFLLCIIEQHAVQHLFKPCFPILDRQQERDFKKLVDARLAILERNKLLPHGCARKSIVSSAGGDRFIDLLWSLSSLAVQHACLSHPPYASSNSRLHLQPVHHSYDAASTASSSRSQRSLHSFTKSKSPNSSATANPPSSRRFLGMGMVTAAQQRAQNAHHMRARIHAQRAAMARTAHMGKNAALHWNSEAGSLRYKISDFEAKLRCLKMQLTAMGFDENGNDIRGGDAPQLDSARSRPAAPLKAAAAAAINASSPADTLTDELKTSPIDSTESGSSVGDAVESVDGEPLSTDLKRLLMFADETRASREQLCDDLDDVPGVNVSDVSAQQIAGLVRAATEELQLATDRMDEIRDARREKQSTPAGLHQCLRRQPAVASAALLSAVETRSACPPPLPIAHRSEVDITSSSSTVTDEEKALNNEKEQAAKQLSASEAQLEDGDPTNPLRACVEDALTKHKAVLESSKKLTQEANEFVAKSEAALKLMEPIDSDESVRGNDQHDVTNSSKPSWFIHASNDAAIIATQLEKNAKQNSRPDENGNVSSEKDVQQAARLLEKSVASRSKSSTESTRGRRRKNGSRSLDCINLMTQSATGSVDLASDNSSAMLCTPSSTASSTKTARSVRFAELPPSYSATRSGDEAGVVSSGKPGKIRCATEIHPSSAPAPTSTTAASSSSSTSVASDEPKKLAKQEDRSNSRTTAAVPAVEDSANITRRDASERLTRARTFTEKTDLQARKDAAGARSRRRDPYVTKNEKGRPATQVTSNRPPRLQRTQTPRRVMRRKDVIERSAIPQPAAAKPRPPRRSPPRSASVDDLNKISRSRNRAAFVQADATSGGRDMAVTSKDVATISKDSAEEQSLNANATTVKFTTNSSKCSDDEICDEVRDGGESSQSSVEENVEERQPTPKARESVQKKLFMTPEPAGSSSTAVETPGDKLDAVERMYGLRKATGTVKNALTPDNNTVKTSKFEFLQSMTPLPGSGAMNQSGSLSDEDVLFSPATRVPQSQIPNRPKATSSEGFFAGEAAQWQQSVRTQNGTENSMFREGTLTRTTSESTSRRSRFTGMLSSSSNSGGKKSRVQLLRARLAALNK